MAGIVVGTASGLVALDPGGRERWRAGREPVVATPVIADLDGDGRPEVLAGDSLGVVRCLDLVSGRLRWEWDPGNGQPVEGEVAVADMNGDGVLDVVVTSHDQTITCLDGRGRVVEGPAGRGR